MDKTVSTIFKVLICTMILIIVIPLTIEYVNVTRTSSTLQINLVKAMNLSCNYYAQETYKRGNKAELGNIYNINSGGSNISGKFYSGVTSKDAYSALYFNLNGGSNNPGWMQFYNSPLKTDVYPETLGLYEMVANGEYFVRDMEITPLNLGITYIDSNTLLSIAKWYIASIFSNLDENVGVGNIPGEWDMPTGVNNTVKYNGFIIDIDSLQFIGVDQIDLPVGTQYRQEIQGITYGVVDRNTKAFHEITGMEIDTATSGESRHVTFATISFNIGIYYEGVTWLRALHNYMSSDGTGTTRSNVNGMSGAASGISGISGQYNSQTKTKSRFGGIYSMMGSEKVPTNGKVVYYVIR